MAGRAVVGAGRRGKNIVIELDPPAVLLVHLGMTGKLVMPPSGAPPTHPAIRFGLKGGGVLVYDDVRRFGVVELLTPDAWEARSRLLGPEPLEPSFTAKDFAVGLARSRSPVRSWLLDQRRIAGVGNIYANEALWRARVHPVRPARSLTAGEGRALHRAVRRVLRSAIEHGGTTLRNYRDVTGEAGKNAPRLAVYGRAGEPCVRCGRSVKRIVFGNRSAFLCEECQPWDGKLT